MELQFDKTVCPCLQKVMSKPQTQELTQELRLPDTMPDIGRILGCWGQPLIRGKEWHSGGMTVTGGVMAWVLYAPEDGSMPQSMDAWLPFQMKWDLPETQHDGFIWVDPYLKAMDCRSLSARKMMIRSGITLMADALEPVESEIWNAGNVPEDVQLLRQTYPMELPQEAGEKPFQLEEEITIPGNLPPLQKIIRTGIQPRVTEQKVMAGKVVFRGSCALHLLYVSDEGAFTTWDFEIPFSQLADLDRDYGPNASAQIHPVVTGLEPYRDTEGKLLIKCGLAAQYKIIDRCMIEVVEDAYSNIRSVQPQQQLLRLPVILDTRREELTLSQSIHADGQGVVDCAALWDYPMLRHAGDIAQAELTGQFQALFMNDSGALQSASVQKQESWSMESDPDNQVQLRLISGWPKASIGSDGMEAAASISLEAAVFSQRGIPMITALELGAVQEPDPARPSLILRKCGESSLWDLAKASGSTVDAICTANQIQQEPVKDRMLLIPIL